MGSFDDLAVTKNSSFLPAVSTSGVPMQVLASQADLAFSANVLALYRQKKSKETKRRQVGDVRLFETFIEDCCNRANLIAPRADYQNNLAAWAYVTYGVLEAYRQWMLSESYAMGTVNGRLYTARLYCKLAYQAGYMSESQYKLVATIEGFCGAESRNVDEERTTKRREGTKKARAVHVDYEQAEAMKNNGNFRDALIMCLLIDHGLRVGEVSALRVENLHMQAGEMVFYRHKVDKWQTHRLTPATLEAAENYLAEHHPVDWLFPGNTKLNPDDARGAILGTRAINRIVGRLGKFEGIEGLSPHDLRHYWATRATRRKTAIHDLQQAGGWRSPYMPLRYAEDNKIANEGVIL